MAVTAQLAPKIALDELAVESWTNQLAWMVTCATPDATTFGSVPYTTSVPGLKTFSMAIGGFNDYAAAAIDEWGRANYGTLQNAVTVVEQGDVVGNTATFSRGLLRNFVHFNAAVGDIPKLALDIQPNGAPVVEGLVTQSATGTITATGHTTPEQVGAITAGQTMWAAIHIFTITGSATPTCTFQLESSATSGGAYTLRGSASAGQTAVGGLMVSNTTVTTDTWWKLALTVSGTTPVFTVLASIARQT